MLSKAAQQVLGIDMVLTVIPAVREVIMDTARDVAHEDDLGTIDPFFVDEIASEVILQLCNFLTQSEIDTEGGMSPLIHPRQLRPKYVRSWFKVEKK